MLLSDDLLLAPWVVQGHAGGQAKTVKQAGRASTKQGQSGSHDQARKASQQGKPRRQVRKASQSDKGKPERQASKASQEGKSEKQAKKGKPVWQRQVREASRLYLESQANIKGGHHFIDCQNGLDVWQARLVVSW